MLTRKEHIFSKLFVPPHGGGTEIRMTLHEAEKGIEYKVTGINTADEELDAFLFSLGCYVGEPITVITKRKSGCVIAIKDGRYHIDRALSEAITV